MDLRQRSANRLWSNNRYNESTGRLALQDRTFVGKSAPFAQVILARRKVQIYDPIWSRSLNEILMCGRNYTFY